MSVCQQTLFRDFAARSGHGLRASCAILSLVFSGAAFAAPHYFIATSAWNAPIPSTAKYSGRAAAPNIVAGLDTWDSSNAWTHPFDAATTANPLQPLLYNSSAWWNVYIGKWKRTGNSSLIEHDILASSTYCFPYPGNVYSSTSTTAWILPGSYNKAISCPYVAGSFRFAANMAPAPGPDGDRHVLQPDGRMVETYVTIVLSTGQVVALSYSVDDPSSAGDGWQNGNTASMLPTYAGQIWDDEIATGINHAIAVTVPVKLLAAKIAYPAYAFDRDATTANPPYSGVIPMGGRMALPPSVSISSLKLQTAEGKAIALAAQRYGFLIVDRGGGGITLEVQPNAPTRDAAMHSWNGSLQADLNAIFAKVQEVTIPVAAAFHGPGLLWSPLIEMVSTSPGLMSASGEPTGAP